MAKYDELVLRLIHQNNGYLHIKQIDELGIDRAKIYPSISNLGLVKAARGIYCPAYMNQDHMFLVCVRNHEVTLSHESAAFVRGLIHEEPEYVSVTIAHSYNAKHLAEKWVTCYQVKREWLDIGREDITDCYGNKVCTYNAERTICDFIREAGYLKQRGNKAPEVAIMNYFTQYPEKNIDRFKEYAHIFNLDNKALHYLQK